MAPVARLVPFPVVLPFGAAVILAALSSRLARWIADAVGLLTAAASVAISLLLLRGAEAGPIIYWFGGWKPDARHFPIGIDFLVDPAAAALAAFVGLLVFLSFLYSSARFRVVKSLYHALVLVFLGAMSGLCLSGDLFNLFVWFELMTAAAVALCAYKCQETGPLQGGLNFAVTNTIGAFVSLSGIAFLYSVSGSLNFAGVAEALRSHPPETAFLAAALLFTIAGFLIKSASFPFHFWLADAHAVAPVGVCVLFSGIMVELGVYAIGRVYFGVFGPVLSGRESAVRTVFIALGAASAVLGALECYVQRHLKRLLAFSTVSHTGLILIGLGLLTPASLAGLFLYVIAHGLLKACLFICAGIFLHRFGTLDESALHGKGRSIPGVGILMTLCALGLLALPPFGTFFADGFLDAARDERDCRWLVAIFIFAAGLTAAAILRFAARSCLGLGEPAPKSRETPSKEDRETEGDTTRTPVLMWIPAVLGLLLALGPALLPAARARAFASAAALSGSHLYAAAVLGTGPLPPAGHPFEPSAKAWPALVSLLVALLLSGSSLWPKTARYARGVFRAWSPFHNFQSGRVTDYVAWLAFGLAAWGGLLLWQLGSGTARAAEPGRPVPGVIPDPDDGTLRLPPGFRALVVADNLKSRFNDAIRFITVAPDGDIYGKLYGDGLIAVGVRKSDGRGEEFRKFGSGPGTGIAVHDGWLYFSTRTGVYRYRLRPGQLVPDGPPQTIIHDLPAGIQHDAKSFAFDDRGHLLVEIGAPYNVYSRNDRSLGATGLDPTDLLKTQGGYWLFDANRLNQVESDGRHFTMGHRHALALAWNPISRDYFMAMMGRDNLNLVDPKDYSAYDNAVRVSEEMHRLRPGINIGWPYSYYDPIRHARMMNPEFGGDNHRRAPAGKYDDPVIAFPAHWAPEQMAFYFARQFPAKYHGGAFLAFHGSYNRAPLPQAGYNVTFIPFDAKGQPTGRFEIFADGFTGLNHPFTEETKARFRPCGLAVGPDGSLYVSDTEKGRIWRILYTGHSRPGAVPVNPVPHLDPDRPPPDVSAGYLTPAARLYQQLCSSCHMEDGSGVPGMQPALKGDPLVSGEPSRLIAVVLRGAAAVSPSVRSHYANAMPSFAGYPDATLAEVMTYVQRTFGKGAVPVTASAVAKAR